MKRIGSIYETICSFENLYAAYLEARKRKRKKAGTAQYEANVLVCTEKLSHILSTKKYKPSKFEVFPVFEPKKRLVQAPAFVDKVVLHAVTDNVLYDALTKSFIRNNHASQKQKGMHDGLDRLKWAMIDYYRKNGTTEGWVLKCDVHHFFASIDHDLLKQKLWAIMVKRGVDPQFFELMCTYIDTTAGLPLGYQTSQLLALLFLDEFDHIVKEKYGVKKYGRYMDDFLAIHPSKEFLKNLLADFRVFMGQLRSGAEREDRHLPSEERHRLPGLPHIPDRNRRRGAEAPQGKGERHPRQSKVLEKSVPGGGSNERSHHQRLRGVGRSCGPR